jgi:putative transcriptional regulator
MSRHPAPEELLLDYAAGALPEGPALVVALHVALDPAARRLVETLSGLGGVLLEDEPAAGVDPSALAHDLDRAMAELDRVTVEPRSVPRPAPPGFEWAPPALRRYLGPAPRWKRKLGGFEEIRLGLHGDSHRVSLLRLQSGKGLPVHHHVGNEYTVVMQGGYTDNTGNYGVGDFAMGPGGQDHEPIADPGEPCIALIVLEKPIVMTSVWGRLFNPLIRWGWM